MTEQTFHITGLDPRSALCGRSGRIWAAPRWPGDDDMRSGRFVRCRDCDRMFTAALETAIKKARDLEHAALTAYRSGWREGCEQPAPAGTGQPGRTPAEGLVRECRELGQRAGAEAARRRGPIRRRPSSIRKTGRRNRHDETGAMSRSKTAKKPLSEQTVRAIRRAYRPGVRLGKLQEQFGLTGGTIISVANRSTYSEYDTGKNEYEPPPHIRGTRRREPVATPAYQEKQPLPIHRTDTRHLIPEAVRAIREAIDDGEPIPRIARSFGLTPETIAHMKQPRTP